MTAPPAPLETGAQVVVGAFLVSGVVHLVRPEVFEPMVPRALPAARGLVHASGVAELVCAVGLLHPPTRRAAGPASAALLLAVYPANLDMARRGWQRWRAGRGTATYAAGTLARLPLQAPLVRWAWRAGRT